MIRKLLLIFIAIAMLGGCSYFSAGEETAAAAETPEPTSTPAPPVVYTPKNYGTLNISMREPKTLNPLLNSDSTVDIVLRLVFEPLFKLDENLRPLPNLAENMEVSPDGLSAVITLKQGLKWSDGEDITADDLVYSIDVLRLYAPETAIYKDMVANVSLCRKIDEKSVRVTYNNQFGGTGYTMCFPLIPKHYYSKSGTDLAPLGSGLYTFESFAKADKLVLVRSADVFQNEPYIDYISAKITPDNETDLHSFDQSLIDLVASGLSDWAKYSGRHDTNITEYTTMYYDFIGFNLDRPIFSNKETRAAVAMALPLDDAINEIYSEHADRALTPVNPNSWLYEPAVMVYSYEPDMARSVLSKLEYGENPIKLLVNTENDERLMLAEMAKLNLEKAGMKVEIETLSFEECVKKLDEGDFDMFVGGFDLSPQSDLTFAFHSSQIDGGKNYFAYNSEEMDELLAQVFFATDETGYKKSLSKIQAHIADELPCISIAFRKSALLSSSKVRGDIKPLFSNIYDNINGWFIAE